MITTTRDLLSQHFPLENIQTEIVQETRARSSGHGGGVM